MASEEYVNPIYMALIEAYGIDDDTAATVNKDIYSQYVKLRDMAAQYAKSKNLEILKRDAQQLRASLDAVKASQTYHASLEKIKSSDRQATVKALVDRANNIDSNYTRMSDQMSKYDSTLMANARKNYTDSGGKANTAWQTFFQTMTDKGVRAVGNDPESVPLATQMVSMTMPGQPDLSKVDPDAVGKQIEAAGGAPELAQQASAFVREAKQKNAEVIVTLKSLDDSRKELRKISAMGTISDDMIERARRLSAEAEERIKAGLGESPAEVERRIEDIRALDTEYQSLLKNAEDARKLAVQPGQEGLRTRMGRIMADPNFIAWAKDNGFKNLGEAMLDDDGEVVYVEGRDDPHAIARYAFQLKHPNRYGPLFGRHGASGQLVRVTATDPTLRASLLKQNDLGGGRYAVDTMGGNTLLSPRQYREQLRENGFESQGFQYAKAGRVDYIKSATGVVYKLEGGKLVKADAPGGLVYKDAAVYEGDRVRYMTAQDLAELPAGAELGYPDEAEAKQIADSSPIRIMTADELPNIGEVQILGFRDRLHASKERQFGAGAISLNNGQYVFTRGVTLEVLDEDRPDLVAGAARTFLPGEIRQKALEARAKKREAGLDYTPLTPDQLSKIPALAEPPAYEPEVIPSALEAEAAASPIPLARGEALARSGVGRLEGVAGAARAAEETPAPAAAPAPAAKVRLKDDAGYTFELDTAAKKITVVEAPTGKPMPKKTEFTVDEARTSGMLSKLKVEQPSAVAPAPAPAPAATPTSTTPAAAAPAAAPAAPPAPAAPAPAPRPTGPVRVSGAPEVRPEPYTVGSFAESKTIDYDAQPRKEPSIFERIAQMRAERVRGAAPPAEEAPEAEKEGEAAAEAGIEGARAPTRRERRVASQRYAQRAMAIEGAEAGVPEQAPTAAGKPETTAADVARGFMLKERAAQEASGASSTPATDAQKKAAAERAEKLRAKLAEGEEAQTTPAPSAPTSSGPMSTFKRLQRNGARRVEPTTSGVA